MGGASSRKGAMPSELRAAPHAVKAAAVQALASEVYRSLPTVAIRRLASWPPTTWQVGG